ncbi:MAG: helix-turn-helix domain-containing protein, partial [Anaerolineae bacterium]
MDHSLDRETRKALVRLAEQDDHEYSVPARIVLALTSGQDVEKIARSVRRPRKEVQQWAERFETEGLDFFGSALQPVSPATKAPQPPVEEMPEAPAYESESGQRRRVNPRQPRPRSPR